MNYVIPVFMGSESDMEFARTVLGEFNSYRISWTKEIISGEKASEECARRVKGYDGLVERASFPQKPAYLAIVGMGNTMGPVITGLTHNPVVTNPKGSKAEVEIDMWSSLRRPRDAPMLTVFGDGKASALYMAEIIGVYDEQIREKVCKNKGIKYEKAPDCISVIYDGKKEDKPLKTILSKAKELNVYPRVHEISEARKSIKEGKYSESGPAILISRLTDGEVRRFAEAMHNPLIVTPSYGKGELATLREDAEGFLGMSLETTLPVGIALLPENAALAALRMSGMRDEELSSKMKHYQERIRNQYNPEVDDMF